MRSSLTGEIYWAAAANHQSGAVGSSLLALPRVAPPRLVGEVLVAEDSGPVALLAAERAPL